MRACRERRRVFPARAGMSPMPGAMRTGYQSVPRASGDEPPVRAWSWLKVVCSPRERG